MLVRFTGDTPYLIVGATWQVAPTQATEIEFSEPNNLSTVPALTLTDSFLDICTQPFKLAP